MSGTVKGGAPWMREAVRQFAHSDPAWLARIEEAIPDGTFVSLFCGARPRPLGAALFRGNEMLARVSPTYHSVGSAAEAVLRAAVTA